jgi:hypothetical protein
VGWDERKRSALVDARIAQARKGQRSQIRKAIQRDPFGYLQEEQGTKLVRPQVEAWNAIGPKLVGRRKTIALPWGRGVGKSFFLRLLAYLLIAQFDGKKLLPESPRTGVRIIWFMDTLKHFKDVHSRLLIEELEGDWAFLGANGPGGNIDKTTWEIRFPGGSWMQPFPALEHTRKAALGQRCDVVLVDECDDVPISTYYSVARPFFTEPWSGKIRVVGGTPRKGRYGLLYDLHEKGLDPEQPRHETFHRTWIDAPEIVDPEEVEDARKDTPPAIFAREWKCEFDNPEGLVYSNWEEDFHVRECPLAEHQWRHVTVGVDWGWTNPGCFLLGVWTGVVNGCYDDARLYIVDELYRTEETIGWWADKAKEWKQLEATRADGAPTGVCARENAEWFADPAEPGSIETIRRKAGVQIRGANNKIIPGVRQVATLLNIYGSKDAGGDTRWCRLHVSARCKNTIREMSTYRRKRDPHDQDRYLEEIEDANNHALDCLRYLVVGKLGVGDRRRRVVTSTSYG